MRVNQDLVEAVALGRMLHQNGSGPLIRALNARLARLAVLETGRVGTGLSQVGQAIEAAMQRLPSELEG